jgi:hypothetical protein
MALRLVDDSGASLDGLGVTEFSTSLRSQNAPWLGSSSQFTANVDG